MERLSAASIEAMDDMVSYAASHHARAAQSAALEHLENLCGVVNETRQAVLVRRISTRQRLLAVAPLTEKARRDLEAANDLDDQELSLLDKSAEMDREAQALGRLMLIGAVGGGIILVAAHFIAMNWGA